MSRMETNGFQMERFIVKCLKCHDIVESKHKDEFVTCKCGNMTIGGGPFKESSITAHSIGYLDLSKLIKINQT